MNLAKALIHFAQISILAAVATGIWYMVYGRDGGWRVFGVAFIVGYGREMFFGRKPSG
jgi:hypothetical protein